MARLHNYSLFTEEGRTRWRNFALRFRSYAFVSSLLGLASGVMVFYSWTYDNFEALERIYFRQYLQATLLTEGAGYIPFREIAKGRYKILVGFNQKTKKWEMVGDEEVYPLIDASSGRYLKDREGVIFNARSGWTSPRWVTLKYPHADIARGMQSVYGGRTYLGLFLPAVIVFVLVMLSGTGGAITVDHLINRKYESGKLLRGTRQIDIRDYAKEMGGVPGLTFMVRAPEDDTRWEKYRRLLFKNAGPRLYPLYIKKDVEAQSVLLSGDTGVGKSQFLHRMLIEMAKRRSRESCIIFDPTGDFVKRHYRPERGDIILNPRDIRCPYWTPGNELRKKQALMDAVMLANAVWPVDKWGESHFFSASTNDILALLFMYLMSPAEVSAWLKDEKRIDALLAESAAKHYVKEDAPQQRGGALGNLARIAKIFKLLPEPDECSVAGSFSFTHWMDMGATGGQRKGWIFLSSDKSIEDALLPLYAIYLEIIMRRLLAGDPEISAQHPIKLIIDEVQTLKHLPSLPRLLTEGRKYGCCTVIACQNVRQLYTFYGQDMAETMLAMPFFKIVMRSFEPNSARWLARLIGGQEKETPQTSVTASVADQGRDSIHYGSHEKQRDVVSAEEIMALRNMMALAISEGLVTKVKLDILKLPAIASGFEARQSLLPEDAAPQSSKKGQKKKTSRPPDIHIGEAIKPTVTPPPPKPGRGVKAPQWYSNGALA